MKKVTPIECAGKPKRMVKNNEPKGCIPTQAKQLLLKHGPQWPLELHSLSLIVLLFILWWYWTIQGDKKSIWNRCHVCVCVSLKSGCIRRLRIIIATCHGTSSLVTKDPTKSHPPPHGFPITNNPNTWHSHLSSYGQATWHSWINQRGG